MKELCGTARNYMMVETVKHELIAHVELILVVFEPQYKIIENDMRMERKFETIRIVTSRTGVKNLINTLKEIDADLQSRSVEPEPEASNGQN